MATDPADWKAYCNWMAEAAHRLADSCDDPTTIGTLLELAAKWIALGEFPPGKVPGPSDVN